VGHHAIHDLDQRSRRTEARKLLELLERGYAIVYDRDGRVLRSPDQVALGEDIAVRLARGEIGARVTKKS